MDTYTDEMDRALLKASIAELIETHSYKGSNPSQLYSQMEASNLLEHAGIVAVVVGLRGTSEQKIKSKSVNPALFISSWALLSNMAKPPTLAQVASAMPHYFCLGRAYSGLPQTHALLFDSQAEWLVANKTFFNAVHMSTANQAKFESVKDTIWNGRDCLDSHGITKDRVRAALTLRGFGLPTGVSQAANSPAPKAQDTSKVQSTSPDPAPVIALPPLDFPEHLSHLQGEGLPREYLEALFEGQLSQQDRLQSYLENIATCNQVIKLSKKDIWAHYMSCKSWFASHKMPHPPKAVPVQDLVDSILAFWKNINGDAIISPVIDDAATDEVKAAQQVEATMARAVEEKICAIRASMQDILNNKDDITRHYANMKKEFPLTK